MIINLPEPVQREEGHNASNNNNIQYLLQLEGEVYQVQPQGTQEFQNPEPLLQLSEPLNLVGHNPLGSPFTSSRTEVSVNQLLGSEIGPLSDAPTQVLQHSLSEGQTKLQLTLPLSIHQQNTQVQKEVTTGVGFNLEEESNAAVGCALLQDLLQNLNNGPGPIVQEGPQFKPLGPPLATPEDSAQEELQLQLGPLMGQHLIEPNQTQLPELPDDIFPEEQVPEEQDFQQALVGDNFQGQLGLQLAAQQLMSVHGADGDNSARSRTLDAEATRLWANFFASGNSSHFHICIPSSWANFFTVQLLNSSSFNQTRQLLTSKLSSLLFTLENNYIDFSIPPTCPDNNFGCSSDVAADVCIHGIGTSKEVPPKKRRISKLSAVVESEVRRSPRLKNAQKGFKANTCIDKNCLACRAVPPVLKKSQIKKLPLSFVAWMMLRLVMNSCS